MIEKEKRFTLELKSNSSLNTRKENEQKKTLESFKSQYLCLFQIRQA